MHGSLGLAYRDEGFRLAVAGVERVNQPFS
jgi:hypothetical protein